jgi:hypothetical protein
MHDDIWDEIEKRGYKIGSDISGGGAGKAETRTLFGVRNILIGMGVLENKHIPSIYLNSSYEQRLDLLRGFMDADGHYHKKRRRFVMSTTREWQRDAFIQLSSSLGLKCTQFSFIKKFNGKNIMVYDICFTSNTLNPFLHRNKDISFETRNHTTFKNIISVEPVPSVPTRCIEVNSKSSTFLYGFTFSITHNTNRLFNFYNLFGYQTLKKPFDHLQNCQWSIYTLQLSTYAYMYELETGKKCRQIWIGYWNKTKEFFERIPIMYLKKEAKQLLDLHKYNMDLA